MHALKRLASLKARLDARSRRSLWLPFFDPFLFLYPLFMLWRLYAHPQR